MQQIVKRPLITEKTMTLAGRGWYSFLIDKDATKREVASALKTLYSVDVKEIKTAHIVGKERRVGKKSLRVRLPDRKKALVRLAKGQTIKAFEVTTEEKP